MKTDSKQDLKNPNAAGVALCDPLKKQISEDLEEDGFLGVAPLSVSQFLETEIAADEYLIRRILKVGGNTVIVGTNDSGKSLLAMMLSVHLALGKDCLGWGIERATTVTFVDGGRETGKTQRRLKQWIKRFPELKDTTQLQVLPIQVAQDEYVDIGSTDGQRLIEECVGDGVEVVVLDNFHIEQKAAAWASINAWMNMLSKKGVALVITSRPSEILKGDRRFWSQVEVSSSRPDNRKGISLSINPSVARRPFKLHMNWKKRIGPTWEYVRGDERPNRDEEVLALKGQGLSNKEIGERVGLHPSNVGRLLHRMNFQTPGG